MAQRRDDSGPQQYVLEEEQPAGPLVRVRCTRCDKKLRVRAVHVGKKVRCPKCGKKVKVVPSADTENIGEMIPDPEPDGSGSRRLIIVIAAGVIVVLAIAVLAIWLLR